MIAERAPLAPETRLPTCGDGCIQVDVYSHQTRRLLPRLFHDPLAHDATAAPAPTTWDALGLVADATRRVARVDGRTVNLTKREWEFLAVLIAADGGVVTILEIHRVFWGSGAPFAPDHRYGAPHAIRVHASRLRSKLDPTARDRFIRTATGGGFRLRREES